MGTRVKTIGSLFWIGFLHLKQKKCKEKVSREKKKNMWKVVGWQDLVKAIKRKSKEEEDDDNLGSRWGQMLFFFCLSWRNWKNMQTLISFALGIIP